MDPQQTAQPASPAGGQPIQPSPLPPPKPRLPFLLGGLFLSLVILGGSYYLFGTKEKTPSQLIPTTSQLPPTVIPTTQLSSSFALTSPNSSLSNFPSLPSNIDPSNNWNQFYCLNPELMEGLNISQKISQYLNEDDQKDFIKMIEETIPKPENSNITNELEFHLICQDNNYLYAIYEINSTVKHSSTLIKPIYAAGGGPSFTKLAIYNKLNSNFEIIESLIEKTTYLNILNRTTTQYGPRLVYYGCRQLVGSKDNFLYISCGGGDGCAYGSNLIRFDLSNLDNLTEILYCSNVDNENSCKQLKCYDQDANLYYQKDTN